MTAYVILCSSFSHFAFNTTMAKVRATAAMARRLLEEAEKGAVDIFYTKSLAPGHVVLLTHGGCQGKTKTKGSFTNADDLSKLATTGLTVDVVGGITSAGYTLSKEGLDGVSKVFREKFVEANKDVMSAIIHSRELYTRQLQELQVSVNEMKMKGKMGMKPGGGGGHDDGESGGGGPDEGDDGESGGPDVGESGGGPGEIFMEAAKKLLED